MLLTAGSVVGRFGCARTSGAMTTYSARQVALAGVPGAPASCLRRASGRALNATYEGTRSGTLKPPLGATKVLLKVTVQGKGAVLRLKAGSKAMVKVGAATKRTAYVVLKLGPGAKAKSFTATLDRRAKVTVTRSGYY